MELSRFLRPSILKFDDWFINVSIGGTGGEDSNIQKDVYFSGKNAYLYASTGSGVTELHIFGNSVQDGTPSIENPVPIISVGDSYLQLYVLDINHPDKRGQIIDFGDIKLRSLPNGVCDEIVYRDKQWRYIQRVYHTYISNAYYHNTTAKFAMVNLNPTYGGLHNNQNCVMSNRFIIGSFEDMSNNIGISYINAVNSTYAFNFENEPGTNDHVQEWLANNPTELIYELAEPIETVLDLPQIEFSSETIYLLTNEQTIKPYLQGYYDVDLKVSGKKLEYIREGLMSWWQPFGLTNADKPTVIPDKLGNSDLTIKNIGYTNESGFHPTYLQFDGIDDNANVIIKRYIGFIQAVVSDLNDNSNRNLALLSNWAGAGSINILFDRNKLVVSNQVADSAKGYIDGEEVTSYNIVNGDGSIHTLAISNSKDGYNLHNIGISGAFSSASNYFVKERFYEAIAYNRVLTDKEVQNNFLVSQIRNGINIPDDVDPIDIIAERTYASGKKFPVYNTYRDRDNDNIESFKILGYTVQEGTPTPEAPIPLLSVGDEGLKLCISDSETGIALQVIDFGNIVLRSLPNGVCDSIEWDGKNWRLVQRIVSIIIDENTTIQDQLEASNRIVVQVNYTLVTKSSANNTNLCSKISNSASSVPRFHNYPNTIYVVWNSNKPATFEEAKSLIMGAEFCCELAEPVETILEGIPAPQTSDNETWFGTPSVLVKPYMMCECKVKKALKYQGDISAWWYFGGNKSNETDRQIIDISGNGNDLTPYNFAWNRESGWNQGGIHSDGIDDYIVANTNILEKGGLITSSNFEYGLGNYPKYVLEGYQRENNILYYPGIRYSNNVIFTLSVAGNTNPESPNGKDYLTTEFTFERGYNITKLTLFTNDGKSQYSTGTMHELVLFENSLTDNQYDNNLNVAKQRNGVDGDINIIPEEVQLLDSQGNELTDSQGYYLTVAS